MIYDGKYYALIRMINNYLFNLKNTIEEMIVNNILRMIKNKIIVKERVIWNKKNN